MTTQHIEHRLDDIADPEALHLEQYAGHWAILPSEGKRLAQLASGMTLADHVRETRAAMAGGERPSLFIMHEQTGTAIIQISGPMTKHGSSLGMGASTLRARRAVREAARDPEVSAIMLLLDTPGGSSNSLADLADDVYEARQQKPIGAFIEDCCCSAGYWVASQADVVWSNQDALVGSIGSYVAVVDSSKAAEDDGFKVTVISSAPMKGAGYPGTEIPEEYYDELQRIVDLHTKHFVADVARGRGVAETAARSWATGNVWTAEEAVGIGLIDRIGTLSEAIADLAQRAATEEDPDMANDPNAPGEPQDTAPATKPAADATPATPPQPVAATFKELEAAYPNAPAAFYATAQRAELTIQQARAVYEAMKTAPVGNEGVSDTGPDDGGFDGDAIVSWEDGIAELESKGRSKAEAVRMMAKRNPQLHNAYLREFNEQYGRGRLVDAGA